MEVVEWVERWVLAPLEEVLRAQGQRHLSKFPEFWYRSPRLHALEAVGFNLAGLVIYLAISPYRAAALAAEKHGRRPRPWTDVVLGLLMLGFVGLQFYVKYSRGGWPDVWYLFMPCHLFTTALAFCLLSTDRMWVNRVFTIMVAYLEWSPVMALLFPDMSDQLFAYEAPVYIIHHIVIIIAPLYMVTQRDRFQLLDRSNYWFGWYLIVIGVFQLNLQTFASYQSGININFQGDLYRLKFLPIFVLLGQLSIWMMEAIARNFGTAAVQKKTKAA